MTGPDKQTDHRKPRVPWWEQILRGERNDLVAQSVRRFAQLGSWGYAAGIKGRELAYHHGFFSVKRLPHPTICVGNITVGGTGKTPLVIRLASDLLERGLRPAVLLRGYKREKSSRHPVIVRDATHICATVAEAGDEAMELASRLPGACVGVGADRHAVGNALLKRHAVDCFILDDGFQHHRLARDINIVTVDVTDRLAVLREEVSTLMRPSSGILESRHEPRHLISLHGRKVLHLSALKGKRVLAISAIGNPKSFENTLAQLGAELVGTLRLSDHGGSAEQVRHWISRNRRHSEWIVMTEKDAMRWELTGAILTGQEGLPSEAFALRMELSFSAGEDHWRKLIALIERLVHAG
jgi:tetraacyldisaccharide 4'-kinase